MEAMSLKSRGGGGGDNSSKSMVSKKWTFLLCLGSFCIGLLFTNRYCLAPVFCYFCVLSFFKFRFFSYGFYLICSVYTFFEPGFARI